MKLPFDSRIQSNRSPGAAGGATKKPRIIIGVTSHLATGLLGGRLAFFKNRGFEVALVSGPGPLLAPFAACEGVRIITVPFEREISIWKDLIVLVRLCSIFRAERPDLIDFGTPKAGLLGLVAGWICGVPRRVYTIRGLRAETVGGLKGFMLRLSERIASAAAHRSVCVSNSLSRRIIDMGLAAPDKVVVLGHGSSNGIQVDKFAPTTSLLRTAAQLRSQLQLGNGPVIGFVGRFTRDKGIPELIGAFDLLLASHPALRLLLVGDFEEGDRIEARLAERIRTDPRIIWEHWTQNVAAHYHVMTVCCLPTHREGFPNVVLEAQAAGRPVVTTDATGAIDSVEPEVTGLVVPVGDTNCLAQALCRLIQDPRLSILMGDNGRARAKEYFDRRIVWENVHQFYCELIDLPVI